MQYTLKIQIDVEHKSAKKKIRTLVLKIEKSLYFTILRSFFLFQFAEEEFVENFFLLLFVRRNFDLQIAKIEDFLIAILQEESFFLTNCPHHFYEEGNISGQ